MDVQVFTRRGLKKDERTVQIEREKIIKLTEENEDRLDILNHYIKEKLVKLLVGQKLKNLAFGLTSGDVIDKVELLEKCDLDSLVKAPIEDKEVIEKLKTYKKAFDKLAKQIEDRFRAQIENIKRGDELAQTVLKVVKIFVAVKRRLQPGDKMAGRHGNKGIISKVVPAEDMPYLEDGTPLDIVLSPLGVPSRMNIGQIMETHLGSAAFFLGKKVQKILGGYNLGELNIADVRNFITEVYNDSKLDKAINACTDKEVLAFAERLKHGVPMATSVFDGAKEKDIVKALQKAEQDTSGQMRIYDGKTGEAFDRKVTVGSIYMLKLHHIVDTKMHARSIGPYSLVTQQPLGGKSHFGGQRFGEMECWALEAYGAAYTLQEILTVKSDDVSGRIRLYESIVRGDNNFEYSIPESFNVMIKELRSLGLNVELEKLEDENLEG